MYLKIDLIKDSTFKTCTLDLNPITCPFSIFISVHFPFWFQSSSSSICKFDFNPLMQSSSGLISVQSLSLCQISIKAIIEGTLHGILSGKNINKKKADHNHCRCDSNKRIQGWNSQFQRMKKKFTPYSFTWTSNVWNRYVDGWECLRSLKRYFIWTSHPKFCRNVLSIINTPWGRQDVHSNLGKPPPLLV